MLEKYVNKIIDRAFQVAKIKSSDINLNENELNDARYSLNSMLKSWDNRGFHIWKKKKGNLLLSKNKESYSIPNDFCAENIFINKIVGIEQTGQYFLPLKDVDEVIPNMELKIYTEFKDYSFNIEKIEDNVIKIDGEIKSNIPSNTDVFIGININKSKTVEMIEEETLFLKLDNQKINLYDIVYIKTQEGWIERRVVNKKEDGCQLNESVNNIDENSLVVFGSTLLLKQISEDLYLTYKTVILENFNDKEFIEGQTFIYFDNEKNRYINKIKLIDNNKIILEEEIEHNVLKDLSFNFKFDKKEKFIIEQYPAGALDEDFIMQSPVYDDNIMLYCNNDVYYSLDKGTTWNIANATASMIQKLNNIFFAYGDNGLYYSYNGIDWTKVDNVLGFDTNYISMFFYNEKYYLCMGNNFYHSENGITWNCIESENSLDNPVLFNGYIYAGIEDDFIVKINLFDYTIEKINTELEIPAYKFIFNKDILAFCKEFALNKNDEIYKTFYNFSELNQDTIPMNVNNILLRRNGNLELFDNDYCKFISLIDANSDVLKQRIGYNEFNNQISFTDATTNSFYRIYQENLETTTIEEKPLFCATLQNIVKKPDSIENIKLYSIIDNRESNINIISRNEFIGLPRSYNSIPTQVYYDKKSEEGIVNFWNIPDSDYIYVEFDYIESLNPVENSKEIPDFPDEFVEAVIYNLAYKLAIEYGVPVDDLTALKQEAVEMLEFAEMHDNEDCSIYLKPGR